MPRKIEIQTMQKDIEKLRKKVSISEPLTTTKKEVPPEKLPGEALPSEPIIGATKPPEQAKPPEPAKPVKPVTPLGILRPRTEEQPPRFQLPRSIIVLTLILLIGGGIYYWWNFLKPPEKPEPEIPASFIETETTKIIAIKEGKETELFKTLKKEASGFQEDGTFRRILVKKITREKDYFLLFKDFVEILEITIPDDVSYNLGNAYTLFFYAQGGEIRMGFMGEISDSFNLNQRLKSWEKTMKQDLEPIFLGQEPGEPAIEEFQDSNYRGAAIRYINFSGSSLAIDYAVVGNYLIITTSKESMRATIDRIF